MKRRDQCIFAVMCGYLYSAFIFSPYLNLSNPSNKSQAMKFVVYMYVLHQIVFCCCCCCSINYWGQQKKKKARKKQKRKKKTTKKIPINFTLMKITVEDCSEDARKKKKNASYFFHPVFFPFFSVNSMPF